MGLIDRIWRSFQGAPLAHPVEPGEEDNVPRLVAAPYPARVVLDWTPASIREAVAEADGGSLMRAADLWTAISREPRVRGIMQTRTLGQVALPLTFECSQVRPKKYVESVWDRVAPDAELAQLVDQALGVGVGLAQMVEVVAPDGTRIPKLDVWDSRWLRYDYSDPQQPRWFVQTSDGEIEITPGHGWILFFPYGQKEPWRRGLWQSLAVPWLLKQYALLDRASHSEVNGSPAWVATMKGRDEGMRQKFLTQLRALGRDARFVLPEGCTLELLEASAKTSEIYTETVNWADQEIAIAIAGQSVTTEGTKGFAEGDIHERILSTLIRATANALEACLYDQLMRPWIAWAFDRSVATPCPRWRTLPREDLQREAAALQTLGQGLLALDQALAPSGKRVSAMTICERFNIPLEALPMEQEKRIEKAIPLAPTDLAAVVYANEARESNGLLPRPEFEGTSILALKEKLAAERKAAEVDAQARADADATNPPTETPEEAPALPAGEDSDDASE